MTDTNGAPHEDIQAEPQSVPPHDDRYIHSDIFDRLVDDEDDVVGLVAYGLYQIRKRQWMEEHLKRNGKSPDEDDLKAFSFGFRDAAIDALTKDAEGVLFRFGDYYVQEQLPNLQSVAFNEKTSSELTKLNSKVAAISGYRHHIVGHIAGFFVLVLLFYFFTRIIAYEPRIGHFLGIGSEPPMEAPKTGGLKNP